jgi:GTP cyclohydrolase I
MSEPRSDLDRAREAVAMLLTSVGAPAASDPELRDTPDRVARMYIDELLDGYRADVSAIVRDGLTHGPPGLVVLTGIRYVSFCPHHFLPSRGIADIAYVSQGRVAGLGTLVRVLDAYAHRLVLQETLGERVGEAVVEHLGAKGAAVRLRARHDCLSVRGERQRASRVVTVAYVGSMRDDLDARAMFTRSLPTRGKPR